LVTFSAKLYFALNQGLATNPQPAAKNRVLAFHVTAQNVRGWHGHFQNGGAGLFEFVAGAVARYCITYWTIPGVTG
jgi:hypothetical protein